MSVWSGFFYSISNQVKPNLVGFFNRFGAVFRFGLYTPLANSKKLLDTKNIYSANKANYGLK